MSTLADITILITSFLRPGYLLECVQGIRLLMPEVHIIIVDDSGGKVSPTPYLTVPNTEFVVMPFDSGLTVKRNRGVQLCETKYVLCGSDDFDFGTYEARQGVEKLLAVLDGNNTLDIASGRHNNLPYEGYLEYVPGEYIKETRIKEVVADDLFFNPECPKCRSGAHGGFYKVDLTVNYFLARTDVLLKFPWDETIVPIGGEHGDFFLTLKENNRYVVWVPGVNIDSIEYESWKALPEYAAFRGRAKEYGHKIFMEKRNIRSYFGFDDPVV